MGDWLRSPGFLLACCVIAVMGWLAAATKLGGVW